MKKILFTILACVLFISFTGGNVAKANSQFDQLTYDGTTGVGGSPSGGLATIMHLSSSDVVTNITFRGHGSPYSDTCSNLGIYPSLFLTIAAEGDSAPQFKVNYRKSKKKQLRKKTTKGVFLAVW